MTPFQAALKGVREISFAVVAMTLTLTAVFAPLADLVRELREDREGR